MEFHRLTIDLPNKNSSIFIEPLGDIHIGNKGVNYEKLQERIDAIRKDPLRRTIIMGDCIDNIQAYANGAADKRWGSGIPNSLDERFQEPVEQVDEFVRMMLPIKDKILGIMAGNHEYKTISRKAFEKDMVKPLETKYLGAKCMVHITTKYKNMEVGDVEIYAMHGSYAGQQVGGGINQLILSSADVLADIYLMGHVHDKMVYPVDCIYHKIKDNTAGKKTRIFALTGTFLETIVAGVDSYTDRKTRVRNAKIGTITLEFNSLANRIHGHE